jgi:hypothetical protein
MSSELPLNLPTNRKFGFFFTVVFLLVALWLYWHSNSTMSTLLFVVIASSFLLVSIFTPQFLTPLNKIWYYFGILLGRIASPVVLGLIFFLIITPIALVIRLQGRDNLRLKKKSVQTYWVDRSPPGPTADSFKNQY